MKKRILIFCSDSYKLPALLSECEHYEIVCIDANSILMLDDCLKANPVSFTNQTEKEIIVFRGRKFLFDEFYFSDECGQLAPNIISLFSNFTPFNQLNFIDDRNELAKYVVTSLGELSVITNTEGLKKLELKGNYFSLFPLYKASMSMTFFDTDVNIEAAANTFINEYGLLCVLGEIEIPNLSSLKISVIEIKKSSTKIYSDEPLNVTKFDKKLITKMQYALSNFGIYDTQIVINNGEISDVRCNNINSLVIKSSNKKSIEKIG